jgi:hypothetical protein
MAVMNFLSQMNVSTVKGFGGFEMTPLLLVCVAVAAPLVGLGLLHMQARLEQWDYERHADD